MWTPIVAACRAALPFFIDNVLPIVEFALVLLLLVWRQKDAATNKALRKVIEARTKRFDDIEADLEAIKKATNNGQR